MTSFTLSQIDTRRPGPAGLTGGCAHSEWQITAMSVDFTAQDYITFVNITAEYKNS